MSNCNIRFNVGIFKDHSMVYHKTRQLSASKFWTEEYSGNVLCVLYVKELEIRDHLSSKLTVRVKDIG